MEIGTTVSAQEGVYSQGYQISSGLVDASSNAGAQKLEQQSQPAENKKGSPFPASTGVADSPGEETALSSNYDIRVLQAGGSPDASGEEYSKGDQAEGRNTEAGVSTTSDPNALTEEEQEQLDELKARDLEVRQHEQAHLAAAGPYARGGAQYEYQSGPDGQQYAIGGHVNLDTSEESSPQATIAKAKQIQRAAMAPAEPSAQDIKVAAQATQMMIRAQQELNSEQSNLDEEGNTSAPVAVSSYPQTSALEKYAAIKALV